MMTTAAGFQVIVIGGNVKSHAKGAIKRYRRCARFSRGDAEETVDTDTLARGLRLTSAWNVRFMLADLYRKPIVEYLFTCRSITGSET